MGIGLGNWALLGDSEFTGGTVGDLFVNGNLTANTYYSGSTPLETIITDMITDYVTPETTGYTFDSIGVAVSDETTAITSGATKLSFRMPYDFQLTGVTAYLVTTGSTSTIIDVNAAGASVLSSAITISSGGFYTVATNITTSALTEHQLITFDIDSAGTGAKGLKVWLEGLRMQSALGASDAQGDVTRVQPGTYITTGGTANFPTVNLASNINLTSISASTIYSGSTNLYDIFSTGSGDITRVQPGTNITTGGTANFPIINTVDSPVFNNLSWSGTAYGGALSATSISATTFFSAGTSLEQIIQAIAVAYGGGSGSGNTYGGAPVGSIISWHNSFSGTPSLPDGWVECNGQTITDVASPYYGQATPNLNGNIVYTTYNADNGTYSTGITDGGYFLRGTTGATGVFQTDLTNTAALNVYSSNGGTGGGKSWFSMTNGGVTVGYTSNKIRHNTNLEYETRPHNFSVRWIIKIKETLGNVNSASTYSFSAASITTLSATTIYSGGTDLYDIIVSAASTKVQPGSNITTGGTVSQPVINLAASPSVNNLTFSGTATGGNVSASSLSGTNIYSGSTNLNSVFAPIVHSHTLPYEFIVAASDETTAITTGTSKVTFISPCSFTLTGVTASLTTTGSTLSTFNVKKAGTTIFSTKVTIDAYEKNSTTAATPAVITGGTWSQFDEIKVDFDGAGSGSTGVKLLFTGYRIL